MELFANVDGFLLFTVADVNVLQKLVGDQFQRVLRPSLYTTNRKKVKKR